MASLKDIAKDLNISVSLVSKVLNGNLGTSGASAETAAAIRRRAVEIRYQRNTSALALRSGRHNVLGVFIHKVGTEASGISESMVDAISEEAQRYNQRLFLSFYQSPEELKSLFLQAQRGLIDGLIVGGIIHKDLIPWLLRVRTDGLPVVTIHDSPTHPKLPNARTDQEEVARVATQHLITQGCRHIGMIDYNVDRYQGYVNALQTADLPIDKELIFSTDSFLYAEGERAATYFLDKKLPIDGIFAQSDQLAIGALNTLLKAGVKVPQQVRIIGVDNSPFCEFSLVKLSSIYQNHPTRGRYAVQMLMEQISGKSVSSVSVEPVLKIRESSL